MRYSFITHKSTLDKVIQHLRTGVPLNKDDRTACADVLGSLRDWVASTERRVAQDGRKSFRDIKSYRRRKRWL